MFRTSLLRTASTVAARRAVVPAARTFVSRPVAAALRVNAKAVAPVAWKVGSVRAYSAAGGLSKEDVEGRIVGLLAGFDKVSFLLIFGLWRLLNLLFSCTCTRYQLGRSGAASGVGRKRAAWAREHITRKSTAIDLGGSMDDPLAKLLNTTANIFIHRSTTRATYALYPPSSRPLDCRGIIEPSTDVSYYMQNRSSPPPTLPTTLAWTASIPWR